MQFICMRFTGETINTGPKDQWNHDSSLQVLDYITHAEEDVINEERQQVCQVTQMAYPAIHVKCDNKAHKHMSHF